MNRIALGEKPFWIIHKYNYRKKSQPLHTKYIYTFSIYTNKNIKAIDVICWKQLTQQHTNDEIPFLSFQK